MDKQRYMISDAAAIANVESHVLRYWEEELELDIPRNEMGHRYYTKENIDEFMRIKELKEQGYQLKAIKMILHQDPEMLDTEGMNILHNDITESSQSYQGGMNMQQWNNQPAQLQKRQHEVATGSNQARLDQFQAMMTQIVKDAIHDNNRELGKEVGEEVGVRVLKEMNYLIREQDEQAEERYHRLDEAIRSIHKKKVKQKTKRVFGKKQELNPNQA